MYGDDRFIRMAKFLTPSQRQAAFTKLGRQRRFLAWAAVAQTLGLVGDQAGRWFGDPSYASVFAPIAFCLALSLISLRDIATRRWILELLGDDPNPQL